MKEITVTVSGLSPFCMTVDYQPQISEVDNILRALSCASALASREAVNELTIQNAATSSADKPVYEAFFELKDGRKYLGYSREADLKINGSFVHCSATKELKGLMAVSLSDISHFKFTPV